MIYSGLVFFTSFCIILLLGCKTRNRCQMLCLHLTAAQSNAESFSKTRPMTQARETESAPLLALCSTRALYMGELQKNTTSTGTITKKNLVTLAQFRQKIFFMM